MIDDGATSSRSAAPVMETRKGSVSATLLRNCQPGRGPSQGKSPALGLTGSGVAGQAGQGADAGIDAASRRDGATDWADGGGGTGQAAGDGACVCRAAGRDIGAERGADADCAPKWRGRCEYDGQSSDGQGRQRRPVDGAHCGAPGAVSW